MIDKNLVSNLREIAELINLKEDNQFRSRAYLDAADTIERDLLDVYSLVAEGKLSEIKGFGKALVEKISDYVLTGTMTYLENLRQEVPQGLIELSSINGLGTKKARQLYYETDIKSINELKKAINDGSLAQVKGFAEKAIANIQKSLDTKERSFNKTLLGNAEMLVSFYLNDLKAFTNASKITITGDYLRKLEVIEKLSFVVDTISYEAYIDFINDKFEYTLVDNVLIISGKHEADVEIIFTSAEDFWYEVFSRSGSKNFNDGIKEFMQAQGISIEKSQLLKNGNALKFESEMDIFNQIGLQFIPYELREEPETLIFAASGVLPDLMQEHDMRGMLHCHSTWSDGEDTLRNMAIGAKNLGFEYFAICDHSKTAVYANGLNLDRLLQQHKEIDELNNENLGIKILKGIESDILADGSLDYPDEILESFDLVVASVHSNVKMPKDEMTERIIKALSNPYTTILGHPTGRLLLRRDPYQLDVYAVIEAAAKYNKVIEINSNILRLDLDWRYVKYAKEKGVKFAINPDAHSVKKLEHYRLGIPIARKGWLSKNDVINTMPYEQFKNFIKRK